MRVARMALAAAIAALAAGPGVARSAPAWVPFDPTGSTGSSGEPPFSGNARGDLLLAGSTGSSTPVPYSLVTGSLRPAGAGWGAPFSLNASGFGSGVGLRAGAMLPDGTGLLAVTTSGADGAAEPVTYERPPGGAWGIVPGPALSAVVVGAGGDVAGLTPDEPLALVRRLGSGRWTAPDPLPAGAAAPQLGIASDGTVTATWTTAAGELRTASESAAGGWTEPVTLGSIAAYDVARLAVSSTGAAVAVWPRADGDGRFGLVAALRPAGGDWGAAFVLAAAAADHVYADPAATIDASGLATVTWVDTRFRGEFDPTEDTVRAAQGRAGDGFGAPETLIEGGYDLAASVGGNTAGEVVAVVIDGDQQALGLSRRPGTAWSTPLPIPLGLSPPRVTGRVLVDADGNAAALIGDPGGRTARGWTVHGYDAAGPRLDRVATPAQVTAGAAYSPTGAPYDTWSSVERTTWDFGDGSAPVDGEDPTHVYATPGTRTVTITSRDTLGNTSRATRTVEVVDTAGAAVRRLRVDPLALDPVAGAVLRGTVPAAVDGTLELLRLDGTTLVPIATLPLPLAAGPLALPLRGSLAQDLGPGVYVVRYGAAGRRGAATLFTVGA